MKGKSPVPPIFILAGVAIFVACVLGVGIQFVNTKPPADASASGRNSSDRNPATGSPLPGSPQASQEVKPQPRDTTAENLAVAMSRVEGALGKCDRSRSKLDRLAGLVAEWLKLTKDIETSDDGRRIASSEVAVRTYLEVVSASDGYADEGLVGRLRERLRLLEAIPKTAKEGQDKTYVVSDAWAGDVAKLEGDTLRESVKLEHATGLMASLFNANPKPVADAPTLSAAIAAVKKKSADEKLALIWKKEAEAAKVGNDLIAEARKAAVETEKKLEAKKTADAAASLEEKAKKEKLRVKAKSDEVKKYLGHFFVESYYQPTFFDKQSGGRWLHLERTDKKEPMSYARLVRLGATAKGLEGLYAVNMLSGACGAYNVDKYERPMVKADYNPDKWSNDRHEFLEKGRDLLVELGPILVEEGLLSK